MPTYSVRCIVMVLALVLRTANSSPKAQGQPTPAQLAWQADEIGVIIHFNMVDGAINIHYGFISMLTH